MLSIETEKKLAELLYTTLIGEKRVEESRFSLYRNRDFELNCAFKELDRIAMGSISSSDIKYFLEKNRIQCTSEEAYLIIRQYDTNSDGRLSVFEFKGLVSPKTMTISTESRSNHSRLSLDAEFLLTKLLENEVLLQRNLENTRKELIDSPDFNLMEGFRSLDKRNVTHIDEEALYIYLKRNGFNICDIDMIHIMNRIDSDKDGLISYVEFVDTVLPNEPHSRNKSPSKSFRKSTPLKASQRQKSPEKEVSVQNFSPLRSSSSPLRSSMLSSNKDNAQRHSPTMKDVSISTHSPSYYKSSYVNEFYSSHDRSTVRNSSPLRKSSNLNNSSGSQNISSLYESRRDNSASKGYNPDEREIVKCLQEEIKISREIEAIKNELCLKADFNLIDAFRMFDINDRGLIDIADIDNFIKDFSIPIDREEIYLFIRHYSHLQDSCLRFSDFSEIFSPQQEEYARLLRNRTAYNLPTSQRRRAFSRDTMALFLDMLKILMHSESDSERLRQRLARIPDFRIQDAFISFDRDGDGFITIGELKQILDENKIFPTVKDLKYLMQRYDKNRDGRVSLTEFIQEVTPKSPKKY